LYNFLLLILIIIPENMGADNTWQGAGKYHEFFNLLDPNNSMILIYLEDK